MLQSAIRPHSEFATDDARDTGGVSGLCETHGAAEFIVIGECDGGLSRDDSACDEFFGSGCTVKQRERTVTMQFDVIGGAHV